MRLQDILRGIIRVLKFLQRLFSSEIFYNGPFSFFLFHAFPPSSSYFKFSHSQLKGRTLTLPLLQQISLLLCTHKRAQTHTICRVPVLTIT